VGLIRGRFGGDGPKYEVADVYRGLRAQAFALAQGDLEMTQDGEVLAVVMDTDLGDAAYTLLAAADGALSLYFSNGGGIIGTGEYQRVGAQAAAFVGQAAGYSAHLAECADPALPGGGQVRTSVVFEGRVLSGEFDEEDLGNDRLPLSPLFHQAHHLIATVRQVDQMRSGEPPLIFAVWAGEYGGVQRLLEDDAAVDTLSSVGVPAIGVAVLSGDAAIVGQLLDAGADSNARDQGANPELPEEAGYTPLMMAANAGQTECVRLLLERGAQPSAVDSNNCNALMFGAQHGHSEIVRLLLASGVDPTFVSSYGLSAIGFAEQHGHAEVLALMRAEH